MMPMNKCKSCIWIVKINDNVWYCMFSKCINKYTRDHISKGHRVVGE